MTDSSSLLPFVLARDRSEVDRLAALADLAGQLGDPDTLAVLLELATSEPSLTVRTAMLRAAVSVDITRIVDRAGHAQTWAAIAAGEPVAELRQLALHRLVACGSSDAVVDMLATLAVDDLDADVRHQALIALAQASRLSDAAAAILAERAAYAAPGEDGLLLRLAARMPEGPGQQTLAALLAPTRDAEVRRAAAAALRGYVRLQPEAHAALLAVLTLQPDEDSLRWAIAALTGASTIAPEWLAGILAIATALPSRAGILQAVRDRLDAAPDVAAAVEAAVLASATPGLWLEGISILAAAGRERVPLAGLSAASVAVRSAALDWAEQAPDSRSEAILAAVARQVPVEALAGLRLRQAAILARARMLPAEAGPALIAHLPTETVPAISRDLCWALLHCQIAGGPVRGALLTHLRRVLTEPQTTADLRLAISTYLQRVASESGDADCVEALLEALNQATSLDEVERLDRVIRTLQPDATQHAALTFGLLRRYHHLFPQDPLTQWARDIGAAAKSGALPPAALLDTVRLTGASWLLDGVAFADDKDLLLGTVHRAIVADRNLDAQRAIREAYQQKTIRKRDLAGIVRRVAFEPRWHHLAQDALKICEQEQVITPALIDAAWPILLCEPRSDIAYGIAQYFAANVASNPDLASRARASCTPGLHLPFLLLDANPDYTGKVWPIFTILIASGAESIAHVFDDIPVDAGFHLGFLNALRSRERRVPSYWEMPQVMFAAAAMWRRLADDPAQQPLRLALQRLLTGNRPACPRQHTGCEDRSRVWNDFVAKAGMQALEPPMPEIGAELWVAFCQELSPEPGRPPAKLPAMPSGVSLEAVQRLWPFPA